MAFEIMRNQGWGCSSVGELSLCEILGLNPQHKIRGGEGGSGGRERKKGKRERERERERERKGRKGKEKRGVKVINPSFLTQ
jgi:hypothetical protein